MASTDIDGTPILVLSAPEIEYLAELMEDASDREPVFGQQDPIETSTYKKMQRFLGEHSVMCWLDDFNEEAAREMFEEIKAILKARGVDGYED